jgi:hypothetical protein
VTPFFSAWCAGCAIAAAMVLLALVPLRRLLVLIVEWLAIGGAVALIVLAGVSLGLD